MESCLRQEVIAQCPSSDVPLLQIPATLILATSLQPAIDLALPALMTQVEVPKRIKGESDKAIVGGELYPLSGGILNEVAVG